MAISEAPAGSLKPLELDTALLELDEDEALEVLEVELEEAEELEVGEADDVVGEVIVVELNPEACDDDEDEVPVCTPENM